MAVMVSSLGIDLRLGLVDIVFVQLKVVLDASV